MNPFIPLDIVALSSKKMILALNNAGKLICQTSIVTRAFKKFLSNCKNLDDQVRSGCPKIMDFESVLQIIKLIGSLVV